VDWIQLAKYSVKWWVFRKHGNELSSYMKGKEFLGELKDYQFIEKDYSPWSWLSIVCNESAHFIRVLEDTKITPSATDSLS
jgi:hypothetical protein